MSPVYILLAFLCLLEVRSAINNNATPEDAFKECLIAKPQGASLGYCIGYSALSKLQSYDSSPEFDLVDGLSFARDEKMYRDGYNTIGDTNPGDFRSIVDSVGQMFSKRSMRWDMGFVYPGLTMQVAPSSNAGGVLEFVLDTHREGTFSQHSLKEISTGRILARQFLVPLLLGFKFNMATLIPVIFGIIALIAKKAVFLSKVGLILCAALSLGTLLFNYNQQPHHGYGYQQTYHPGFGGHSQQPYRYTEDDYQESSYRGNTNTYSDDQLRLYDGDLQQAYISREEKKQGRNFAWNDADKTKKT